MTTFNLKITTLSPLHIGDGNELRQGFDFEVYNNHTYRLDENKILEARGHLLTPPYKKLPGELLASNDFDNPDFFRYIVSGVPRSNKQDARLKSCIKDVYDCPYIPGSSLKGAMRTALAWTGWEEVNIRLDRTMIGSGNPKFAGQRLEKKLFGPDPNHDLLRALHVGDCLNPQAGKRMLVVNAQVVTLHQASSPIELEAIGGDTPFAGSLEIDDLLFKPLADRELQFGSRKHWLDELVPRIQAHSKARLNKLAIWYEKADGGTSIAAFYRQLLGLSLGENQAVMQFGWGTGWDGTTFGSRLQQDASFFEQIVTDFRLNKAGTRSIRNAGDAFPKSRRVAMKVKNGIGVPAAPLGWVLIELDKKG